MKLRIARKMDPGGADNPKRPTYRPDQYKRAELRLLRSWVTFRTREYDPVRKDFRVGVTEDFFRANRITGQRLRLMAIKRCVKRFKLSPGERVTFAPP